MNPPMRAAITPSGNPPLRFRAFTAILIGSLLCVSAARIRSGVMPPVRAQAAVAKLVRAYAPDRIEKAYDFSPLYARHILGAGQTVALIELNQVVPADVAMFDATYKLPPPILTYHYVGGAYSAPRGPETNLDVEWLHALAPAAAIQIYYIDSAGSLTQVWKSLARAAHQAADNGANIVSISLDACRPGNSLTVARSALADLARRKISVFVSSGDYGDRPGPKLECGSKIGVSYPTGDPAVVSVGGTSLALNANDGILRETAWKLSGGGRFQKMQRAEWQLAHGMPKDRYRWVPDVAFLGDPGTGVRFVNGGAWRMAAGTSLGAPAWAAIWALVRQLAGAAGKSPDVAQQAIYRIGNSAQYATAFHDIVSGSNGRYHAGKGWDAVTGWGTPDVASLADAIVAQAAP